LKAPAQRERRRGVLLLCLLRDGRGGLGMKESSRREERYWVRLEEMSERVWKFR
jgi:hypothetical protein